MFQMRGVVPPMITPFTESGDLDVDGLKTLVRFLREEVHGLFVTGSYGSGPMMRVAERKLVTEISMREAGGKVPIIPMVGTTNTRDSVELAKHAEETGAAAVAAVGPFYFEHDEERLRRFFGELIAALVVLGEMNMSVQDHPDTPMW